MKKLGSYNINSIESFGIPIIHMNFLKDVFQFLTISFCLVIESFMAADTYVK
jgi:hypothetical protein